MYRNREEAGKLLAKKVQEEVQVLPGFDPSDFIVIGLPRGGVPVAKEVAAALNCRLTILVSKKIGAPFQPEYAIGAVTSAGDVVLNEQLTEMKRLEKYIDSQRRRLTDATKTLERHWLDGAGIEDGTSFAGKKVILVDDGVATGMTTLAAIRSLRNAGAVDITLATPVIAVDARARLKKECERIISLQSPSEFYAIGQYFADFHQVEDSEVIEDLRAFAKAKPVCQKPA